jgi:putative drug exporter of the RND superfamily
MDALARVVAGSRFRAGLTVVAWLMVVGFLTSVAPTLKSVEDNATVNLPPASSNSLAARTLADQAFPSEKGIPALVVVHDAAGLDGAGRQAVADITDVLDGPGRPDGVLGAVSATNSHGQGGNLISADGRSAIIAVPIDGNPADQAFLDTVDAVRDVAAAHDDGLDVAVTGPAGIIRDTVKVFSSGDKVLLLLTVILVLVLLLTIYRSPLLALVPVIAAGLAMQVTQALGALGADAGLFSVNSQAASIMTVLLFGVGTDYALLITARYREALLDEPDLASAMTSALRAATAALLSSASTVILAMLALLVAVLPALRGFGPYLALSVAVMVVCALTFIPSLVLLLGRKVFWPRTPAAAAARVSKTGVWDRSADLVSRRPTAVIAGAVAVLSLMSLGLSAYQETFNFISGFHTDTDAERGQQLLLDSYPAGELAPTTVLVHDGGNSLHGRGEDLRQVGTALAAAPGVDGVNGPAQISPDGHTARYTVVLDSDPYGAKALDLIPHLQAHADAAAQKQVPGGEVLLGGETALNYEVRSALHRDVLVLIVVILTLVLLVLGLLLRSVLAPVYLVTTTFLSFLATMGLTTFVACTLLGDEGIGNRVTAYVFVFLVALGVDYNIFIMDRFKKELRHHSAPEALRTSIARTGGVVTSAGIILAATFSVLMTQPIRELFQFGFALAIGILLDTFVIRTLLVPAIVARLGRHALWPTPIPPNGPHHQAPVDGSALAGRT